MSAASVCCRAIPQTKCCLTTNAVSVCLHWAAAMKVREWREVENLGVVGRELQQKRPVSVPTVVANLIQMVDSFRRRALLLRKLQLLSIT
jgi:hypothetical protein